MAVNRSITPSTIRGSRLGLKVAVMRQIQERIYGEDERDAPITVVSDLSARLGFDIVEIGGFLDALDADSEAQVAIVDQARVASDKIVSASASAREKAVEVSRTSAAGIDVVTRSVDAIRASGARARSVAEWVQHVEAQFREIASVLAVVEKHNLEIGKIAKQVNMLAINAKIEATHAGDAGRGFAIVADAINELSRKTGDTGGKISDAVRTLSGAVMSLRNEAEGVTAQAGSVLRDSEAADAALSGIAEQVGQTAAAAEEIASEATEMDAALETFTLSFSEIGAQTNRVRDDLGHVKGRVESLIDLSEAIVQASVEAGGAAEDGPFIDQVKDLAGLVSTAFEAGIVSGRISLEALFSRRYTPIRGSNPEQVMAPFTTFTDEVLPPIQEPALNFAPSVVFCAAVDTNGYLPTHNLKFSQPQGPDPVWNAANCRNRRIFDDRVGLKAGRNTKPFLMQIYRRDMGGGNFVMMKDLSAPIFVRGRHWGGVRFAYKV